MAIANLALRFLAELAGIAAVGYAGFQVDGPLPVRVIAAIGAAAVLIADWAAVVAPTATNGLSQTQKDTIGTGILQLSALALAIAGQGWLAIGFAVVVALNAAALVVLGTDARDTLARLAR